MLIYAYVSERISIEERPNYFRPMYQGVNEILDTLTKKDNQAKTIIKYGKN